MMTATPTQNSKKPRTSRKWIAAGAIAAVLAAGAATTAFSHGGMYKGMRHMGVEAEGMMHKARFSHGKPKTIEEAQKRAERMAKHLAIELDANGEQMDKLVVIAKGVAGDLFPIRESIKALREEGLGVLSSDTVDRAKLETMRSDQFTKFEEISKRLTTAMADAADVLNPEQRKQFAERVKDWRGMEGRGHRRGWGKRGSWSDHGDGERGERGPDGPSRD